MKKILASLVVLFTLMLSVPLTAEAHNGCPRHRKARKTYVSRNYRTVRPTYYRTANPTYYRTAGYTINEMV